VCRICVEVSIFYDEDIDTGIFAKTGSNDSASLTAADDDEVVAVEKVIC
jgi:hypothetical protein